MPFNFICSGGRLNNNQKHVVGAGKRYNAKKNHAGDYFSTKIYEFSMKCHDCENPIVIRTDPKVFLYILDCLNCSFLKIESSIFNRKRRES